MLRTFSSYCFWPIVVIGCSQQNPADEPTPPLLCPNCSLGGDTTDFGGEPEDCHSNERAVSREEAKELGYDVEGFLARVEGNFSAPVSWTADGSSSVLSAEVEGSGFALVEREPTADANCPDLLFVDLRIEVGSSDSLVEGQIEGQTTLSHLGTLPPALWVSVRSWTNTLRGKLEVSTEQLGDPQALQVWFNMVVSDTETARLGIEVLGLYDRDLESGDNGYTTTLASAEPTDGCPAFAFKTGDGCENVPIP